MTQADPRPKALVIDADKATVALVRSLLSDARAFRVSGVADEAAAWAMLEILDPAVILVAHTPPVLDAPRLTTKLRLSEFAARFRPVVMYAALPTATEIKAARDSGIDEVLRKPFTANSLVGHVDVALNKQREWIEGVAYVGPDRRRFNAADYAGRRRRRTDQPAVCPHTERINQALKIMSAAMAAIDTEPKQALRSLYAQADEIEQASVALANYNMAGGAQMLRAYLDTAIRSGRFTSHDVASDMGRMFDQQAAPAVAKRA